MRFSCIKLNIGMHMQAPFGDSAFHLQLVVISNSNMKNLPFPNSIFFVFSLSSKTSKDQIYSLFLPMTMHRMNYYNGWLNHLILLRSLINWRRKACFSLIVFARTQFVGQVVPSFKQVSIVIKMAL